MACDSWLGGLLLEAVERHRWHVAHNELQLLRWQAMQIRRGNRRLLEALAGIASVFRDRGVDVLLLKGAGLNLTVYDRPDRRPMSDLDLLVRPDRLFEAMAALADRGYVPGPAFVSRDFFPRFHYAMEYRSPGPNAARVDLHVRPFRPLRYAQTVVGSVFWDHARCVELCGAPLGVPRDEAQFVHLATHSAGHGHSRLLWLYDLCRLVECSRQSLDWDRILHFSRRLRLVLPVRQAVHELETRWGPVAPDEIREALRRERVGWRDRLCLAQAPRDATRPIRHVGVDLACTRGIRFRLAYLRRILVPDAGHMSQVYPRRHRGWLPVAHLRRWFWPLVRPAAHLVGSASRTTRQPPRSRSSLSDRRTTASVYDQG
jgi:hypothetical protein